MPEQPRGTDGAGRRAKQFLSPSQKYEVWLQLVRGETTMADAAARWQVNRSTILRIRSVAKDGALAALAASRPGKKTRERDHELEALRAENARGRSAQGDGRSPDLGGGEDGWGSVAGSRAGWTRPPRPDSWRCSMTPWMRAGRGGGRTASKARHDRPPLELRHRLRTRFEAMSRPSDRRRIYRWMGAARSESRNGMSDLL